MNTPIKIAAVLGIVGIVALVGFAGAAAATGSMPGFSGMSSGGHMGGGDGNCMMNDSCQTGACTGEQCQAGNATCTNGQGCTGMMNGGQCHNSGAQAQAGQYGCGAGGRSCH
jgi:hypothetical protein